jgi:type I restriction enzyme S subunit
MSEWKELRLGELATVIPGYAFKGKDFGDIGCRVVKIGDIAPPIVDAANCLRIPTDKIHGLDKFKLQKGDFVLAMTGATLGKVGKYRSEEIGYINQRVAKFDNKTGISDKQFLYYLITSNYVSNEIINRGLGSAQPNISGKDIESINVVAPDLPTQTAIAEILSSLDDKIELNNKINQELETLAQTLFKQWFIDFEFPNENGEPYKSSGGEMVESELGEIPKGWEVYRFKDIVSNYIDNRGKTPPLANDGIPLVEIKHMVDIGIYPSLKTDKFLSYEVYDTFLRAHLLEDDILMSTVGTIGRLNIVPDFQIFAIAQNVLGIRFKKDLISQLFMFCLMRTKGFNDEINSRLIETVQSSIKRSDLEKIPVILPKRILVERFDDIVKDMFDRIKTSSSEIDELINLRDILLSKLISGELVIYELSN